MTLICPACHRNSDRNKVALAEDQSNCPRDTFPLATMEVPAEYAPGSIIEEKFQIEEVIFSSTPFHVLKAKRSDGQGDGNSIALLIFSSDAVDAQQLSQFWESWKSVSHENVLKVLETGSLASGAKLYAVSEYPYSRTVSEMLDEGNIPMEEAVNLFIQVLSGAQALKDKGILHTNIMPTHVLVFSDPKRGQVLKLSCFDLVQKFIDPAKIESPGADDDERKFLINSPLYRGLESITGAEVDERTSIYSVGCFLYDVLTGLPPYVAKTLKDIARRHVEEQALSLRGAAPELNIPGAFDSLVLKALRNEPTRRQQTLEELKEDILQGAKDSRIYLPNLAKATYKAGLYTGETGSHKQVIEEAPAQPEPAAQEEVAPEDGEPELEPETRAELEAKVKQLRTYVYILTTLLVGSVLFATYLFSSQGSDEDKGPLWKKMLWEYDMSSAGDSFKKGNFDSASGSYKSAMKVAADIEDGGDRQLKSFNGLLRVAKAKGDEKEAEKIRQDIVSLDEERLTKLFESDAKAVADESDFSLSIPKGKMTPDMAEKYTERFITRARDFAKKGEYDKAESFLLQAVELEDKSASGQGKSSELALELAKESKSGEHLDQIASLLEKLLENQASRGDKHSVSRIRSLMSAGLVQARKGNFEAAEEKFDEALSASSSLKEKNSEETTSILKEYKEMLEKAGQGQRAEKYKGHLAGQL